MALPLRIIVNLHQSGQFLGAFSVNCSEEETVEAFKKRIETQEGIPVEKQQIVFHTWNGNKGWTHRLSVEDEKRKLDHYFDLHETNSIILKFIGEGEHDIIKLDPFPKDIGERVVMVVDVSGSMNTKTKAEVGGSTSVMTRYEYAMHCIRTALSSLPDEARFNVIFYSTDVSEVWDELKPATQENVDEVMAELDDLIPGGRTATQDALKWAYNTYAPANGAKCDSIFLVTDGKPDTSSEQIVQKTLRWNMDSFVPCHCVAFMPGGQDFVCERFLMNLSNATNGSYRAPNLINQLD